MTHRADWMHEGSYGLMVHYLPEPEGASSRARADDFNRIVDAFDVDGFMEQFAESGADWLLFTIGQNLGYYCSSNSVLDALVPGRTSRRDLMMELAQAVKGLGKRMLLYLPAEVAQQDDEIRAAFRWTRENLAEFMDVYLQFVEAYSAKFGLLHDGWWFDGCYERYYTLPGWDWRRWLDAARAGNPDSIVAFNDGSFCIGKIQPVTPLEDYLAGEVWLLDDGKIRTDYLHTKMSIQDGRRVVSGEGEPAYHMPKERFINGVQWHALCPFDSSFNGRLYCVSYTDAFLFRWVADCKRAGGAVTLNAPIDQATGLIPASSSAQLKRLGEFLKLE